MTDSNTSKRPSHTIWAVETVDGKPNWDAIGVAWRHKSGAGFALKFNRPIPPGANIVMLPAK